MHLDARRKKPKNPREAEGIATPLGKKKIVF
jgi:hypothetical protein